jgi:hypothetical protein
LKDLERIVEVDVPEFRRQCTKSAAFRDPVAVPTPPKPADGKADPEPQ